MNFKNLKKRGISLALSLSMLAAATACGAIETTTNKAAETTAKAASSAAATTNKPGEKVKITFWHSMGGSGGEGIKKMVAAFNASQPNIEVTEQFQGDYDETINKLKSATKGAAGPDVVQIYDIGTQYMMESGHAVTMQSFIDKDGFDANKLEDNIAAYYKVDGKLYSMPFNSSTPLLYYNATLFKEAGVEVPQSMDEIIEVSKKLAKNDVTGFSLGIYGWFFEQWMSKQGKAYANNDNGRKARATAVDFDANGGGESIAKGWKKMIDSGVVQSFANSGDARTAFVAGKAAMTLQSTASLTGIMKEVGTKFEVGTAFYPKVNANDEGGVSIGGGSIWILENSDDARKNAAWDFVKFMVSPEQQVYWHKQTGYFPINKDSYEIKEMKEHLATNPQFETAIKQLRATKPQYAGALLPVFPEARKTIESELEAMIKNGKTPENMIKDAATSINTSIDKYIKSNK